MVLFKHINHSIHLIILIIVQNLFFSCNDSLQLKEIPKKYEGPLVILRKNTILYSDSGQVRIKVTSPLQYELQDKNREFPEGVKIDFFNAQQQVSSTLTAKYGFQNNNEDKYMVRGDVRVVNIEGKRLFTEELYWYAQKRQITTKKFVKIETPTDTLMGMGLESNEDFSKYKILKPTGKFIAD